MTDAAAKTRLPLFKLAQLEKVLPPDNSKEQDWYRYVLENGRSTIVGQRRGTLKDVTAYATQYAEQLNQRSAMARSTWSTSSSKSAQAAKAKTSSS